MLRRIAKGVFHSLLRIPARLRGRQIVVCYVYPDFQRKVDALVDLLRRQGLPAVALDASSFWARSAIRARSDVYIGFWNFYPSSYLPDEYIFFNAEPLEVPRWRDDKEWFTMMRGASEIWGFTQATQGHVAHLGRPFRYVPFGYAPWYEQSFSKNIGAVRPVEDIDVLFVGSLTDRRQVILDALRERGLRVFNVSRSNPLHGAGLDLAIARAKIVLSMYSYDEPGTHVADFARLDILLSNGRFVVHERLAPANADPGFECAVVTADYADIPSVCARYLANDAERQERALAGKEWFKRERALENFLPFDGLRTQLQRS